MADDPTPEPWAREHLPALPPTGIQYDTPTAGLDPFDLTEPSTQWFVEARGFGRGWVAAGMSSPEVGQLYDDIPMGYRYLAIVEKLAIVSGGLLQREWAPTDEPAKLGYDHLEPYRVYYQSRHPISPYDQSRWYEKAHTADDPAGLPWMNEPLSFGAPTYASALLRTLEHPAHTDSAFLVGRVLRHESWH
ncbi:hypothetical protein [Flindersiella endophytica]